jgi:hypothetical protein
MPRGSRLSGIHGIAGQIVEDTVAAAFRLRHLLFGISPFDPITLGTSIAVVVALTVAASIIPAAAAARIEPRRGAGGLTTAGTVSGRRSMKDRGS